MSLDVAQALAVAQGVSYLEAPAGFGKTETIANAVCLCEEKQLILTHTHAGVDSLKKRLKQKGVPSTRFRVETIDAFCMRYARGYPSTSGFKELDEGDPEIWEKSKIGARDVLVVRAIRGVITSAFGGVIVDEYQDCSKLQHEIIMLLSRSLPVRVLGDPLQALFTWTGQTPISWQLDLVEAGFAALPELSEPQRWLQEGTNHDLGQWIISARSSLQEDIAVTYASPVALYEVEEQDVSQTILKAIAGVKQNCKFGESIIVLHAKFAIAGKGVEKPHLRSTDPYATTLSGQGFTVMMEIEGKLLRSWCEELSELEGLSLAHGILVFADECCSKKTSELAPIRKGLIDGSLSSVRTTKAGQLLAWLRDREQDFGFGNAEEWLGLLGKFDGRKIHHQELFHSMCLTLRKHWDNKSLSLADSARAVREKQSHLGRRVEYRIISRILLVKGLQYDHVIVVRPEDMDACTQYVAFSRAVKSLAVVTTDKMKIKGAYKAVTAVRKKLPVAENGQESLFGDLE